MISSFTVAFLILTGSLLFALVLRFVQPELIYGLRQVLLQIRTNKAFLDYEAGRVNLSPAFQELLIKDFRYEALDVDEEYVFRRVNKIRELYRALDPRRPLAENLLKEQQPQVCIVELAALLGSLGRRVEPKNEYHQPVISGRGLLTHIANEIRSSRQEDALPDDQSVYDWFTENPLSIEQTIEIMIAAALGLAFRQKALAETPVVFRDSPRVDSPLPSIFRVERRLRFIIRLEYQSKYKTEQDRNDRIKIVLGEKAYGEALQRMEERRSHSKGLAIDFFDFLYMGQLETLVFGEWEIFRYIFKEKMWLKQRIEKIVQVRNDLAHARHVPEQSLMLGLGYCGEIEDRLQYHDKNFLNKAS